MNEEKYEVVIVGAGPAGLRAAEILAKNGKKVLVLEKNKTVGEKICGGGLSRKFLKLNYPIQEIGDRFFKTIKYHFLNQEHIINYDSPFIVITERKKLGEHMKENAQKEGAEIRLNSSVLKISEKFLITSKKKIYFDYLVGADGSNSLVRKFLKIPTKKILFSLGYVIPERYKDLEIFFEPEILLDGYGAIFPHKNYTQIGITVDSKFFTMKRAKQTLDKWIKKIKFNIKESKFNSGIINYDYRGFCFKNKFFLVGDAGGFASGLNGEGIFQAVISGEETAKKILNPKYKCPGIDHILKLKFIHEKIFKKILKIKNKKILKGGVKFIIISANPKFYNFYSKIKPIDFKD